MSALTPATPTPAPALEPVLIRSPLIEPRAQERWGIPHATWFSLMGVGAGLFLLARLLRMEPRLGHVLGLPVADLLSFLAIAAGGLILIADLGRPLRVLRAVLRPGASWISRGAVADFVFLVVGTVLVLPDLDLGGTAPFGWLPWAGGGILGSAIEVVALLAAAVVAYYAGQVLADSRGIPYWRSPAIPLQFVLSSLASSMTMVMVLELLNGTTIDPSEWWLLLGLVTLMLVAIVAHLRTARTVPGKAESLALLLRGRQRRPFLLGVVGLGTILPMVLALLALAVPTASAAAAALTLLSTLPAGFLLRLLTLRVGVYPPLSLPIRSRRVSATTG